MTWFYAPTVQGDFDAVVERTCAVLRTERLGHARTVGEPLRAAVDEV